MVTWRLSLVGTVVAECKADAKGFGLVAKRARMAGMGFAICNGGAGLTLAWFVLRARATHMRIAHMRVARVVPKKKLDLPSNGSKVWSASKANDAKRQVKQSQCQARVGLPSNGGKPVSEASDTEAETMV